VATHGLRGLGRPSSQREASEGSRQPPSPCASIRIVALPCGPARRPWWSSSVHSGRFGTPRPQSPSRTPSPGPSSGPSSGPSPRWSSASSPPPGRCWSSSRPPTATEGGSPGPASARRGTMSSRWAVGSWSWSAPVLGRVVAARRGGHRHRRSSPRAGHGCRVAPDRRPGGRHHNRRPPPRRATPAPTRTPPHGRFALVSSPGYPMTGYATRVRSSGADRVRLPRPGPPTAERAPISAIVGRFRPLLGAEGLNCVGGVRGAVGVRLRRPPSARCR